MEGEVYSVMEGEVYSIMEGEVYSIMEGEVYSIMEGEVHSIMESEKRNRYIVDKKHIYKVSFFFQILDSTVLESSGFLLVENERHVKELNKTTCSYINTINTVKINNGSKVHSRY
ncbi:hypothetical protein AVEN_43862-1 [Araneus ventricosus]|uniref:Uncharacterized protein n=1 Tax=Araneus ventricosus TaxID=182803 RepID=A0A4Y2FQ41_ARAVE|nr:hypothetical protein AVEN_43862-1 [Araneus ventricosus]